MSSPRIYPPDCYCPDHGSVHARGCSGCRSAMRARDLIRGRTIEPHVVRGPVEGWELLSAFLDELAARIVRRIPV